jgi:hypothetical protein
MVLRGSPGARDEAKHTRVVTIRHHYVTLAAEVVLMPELANGNSFILANGNSHAVVNMPLEGALALGPGLRVFDTSGFRKLGNAL